MSLSENLRQMLALLERERQALAGLDLERILFCADSKIQICETIAQMEPSQLDEECRGLLAAVSHLNKVNRKLRNMIADGVQHRLESLTGTIQLYAAR